MHRFDLSASRRGCREGGRPRQAGLHPRDALLPELPEVETIRRALALRLIGRRLVGLEQRRPDLRFALPARLPERIAGRTVEAMRRRAKYILADLNNGETLLLHLGMSGRLLFDGPPAGPHEHLTFHFEGGTCLRFVDPRRFGSLDLAATAELARHPRLACLGLEPLEPSFDARALGRALTGRQTALKTALMDQRIVVGVGNIYASEALFRARLRPERTAGFLGPRQLARLVRAIKAVLEDAIAAGGSSLRDYVQADGEVGFFQERFSVYGRTGLPCVRCGESIQQASIGQRTAFFCRRCQR